MILIRIAPTPIFWANLTFATVKASLSDFVITYSVVNLKYALYVYIGHTAGDLLSAAAGDTTPDGSASGSAADDDVPLGANVQTMQLVVSVAGMVCGVVALGVVGVYTKRELAQVIRHIGAEGLDRRGPAGSCRLFLGPGFRLAARWDRLVETVKTRKKWEKTGKKWARYSLKRVKEGS